MCASHVLGEGVDVLGVLGVGVNVLGEGDDVLGDDDDDLV